MVFLDHLRAEPVIADTALVIAVDVSQSVDQSRYNLQMQGIAQAFEDPNVIAALASGDRARILVTLVTWADETEVMIPWYSVSNADEARQLASVIRALPPRTGDFTCMSKMLQHLQVGVLADLHDRASRVVVDVSGDGIDNCAPRSASDDARDELVSLGITINGLPIIVAGENEVVGSGAYRAPSYGLTNLGPDTDTTTLDAWYREHVIGGHSAFIMAAKGYEDFGRAFRQKFVSEVSLR